jgi:hypothetical protein
VSNRVRVWCLRHAESESDPSGRAGAEPTAPLTARGRLQAIAAAQELAAEPITRIYASTALRARQTAALLAAVPALPITEMPELVEVRCTAAELHAWVVEQDLGRRTADGETGHQVVARVTAAFRRIAGAHPGEAVGRRPRRQPRRRPRAALLPRSRGVGHTASARPALPRRVGRPGLAVPGMAHTQVTPPTRQSSTSDRYTSSPGLGY